MTGMRRVESQLSYYLALLSYHSYTCVWSSKKIIKKSDLDKNIDTNLKTSLTVKCQPVGTYDNDVTDYGCTRPCPMAPIPFPDIMTDDQGPNKFGEYGAVRT